MDAPVPPQGSPLVMAYAAARAAAPGHLVLYRVGEFYEVLGDDAATVSRLLGIQLTRRRQKDAPDIPMCGIPAGAAEAAVARLLAAGRKAAMSEQPAEPAGERPLRFMTPGTSVDADVLAAGRPNTLAVAHAEGEAVALAWTDLSTGEAGTCMASLGGCAAALARIVPSEILVSRWPDGSEALALAVRGSGAKFSDLPGDGLRPDEADAVLARAYGSGWREALRGFSPLELTAHTALLDHVRRVLGTLPTGLPLPRRVSAGDTVEIDAPTLRGLGVLTSGSGHDGSLLSVMDRTVTAPGARLLVRQLSAPLTDPATIGRRLAMVRCFVGNPALRADCRDGLGGMPDILRACGRLSLGKAGPRDLAAVRDGLDRASILAGKLGAAGDLPPGLAPVARDLGAASAGPCGALAGALRRALAADPPSSLAEPGFIAKGYAKRLDACRAEAARAKEAIDELQARYVGDTGVKSLRIRVNSVVGHHVEVPAASAQSLGPGFTLRQGLASSTRFSTPELDSLAAVLEEASAQASRAEQAVFVELSAAAMASREALTRIAHAAAALDLVAGLAQAAAEGHWSEPELAGDTGLDIEGGRHPVAEALLDAEGRAFVANGCRMGEADRIWLLTGPNMAGKSTFLKQVAVIVLMAQVGSFVPATRARIGVVDKLFSRVGASDDLAAGRSTFMVEMLETAAILGQATERSLVILDEVGRGTSTHDGLSIAQACMEYLHDVVGCRTLFATHFHELADVADAMPRATCMAMDAAAGRHGDVFTYRIGPGRAGRSHGLKVAALAGLPAPVLARAAELLAGYTSAARSDPAA
jgi:DNA mismatch repair protein MutS